MQCKYSLLELVPILCEAILCPIHPSVLKATLKYSGHASIGIPQSILGSGPYLSMWEPDTIYIVTEGPV